MAEKRDFLKKAHVYKEKNNKRGYVDAGIKPYDRNRSEYPKHYSLSQTVDMKTDPGLSCLEETNDKNTVTTQTVAEKTVVAQTNVRESLEKGSLRRQLTTETKTDMKTDPGLSCLEETNDKNTVTTRTVAEKTVVAQANVRGIPSQTWHPSSMASSLLAAFAGKSIDITNNREDVDEQIIAENLSELTGDIAQKIQELSGQVKHITTKPEFALTREERKLIEEFDELIDLQSFLESPHECLATQCSFID